MTTSTDLPDGFKATPLGLFPKEWDLESIGDLFNIQQGKSLSPKQREGKSPHPFLRTANVYWGKVDLAKVDHMDFTDEEVAKLALQPDDILVCEGGDIGRTAMWRGALENCCYQNHLHRLRTSRADVYPEFFMYWMQAAFKLFGLYGGEGNKTTIPNLSQGRLKAFRVPKPSFQEQQAIAEALTAVRCDIESTEAVIAAACETKRAMMQHLFTYGSTPMAEAGAVAVKETKIGDMPEGWEVVRLETVIHAAKYGLNNRAEATGTYPVFRMNNLVGGLVDTSDLKYVELSPTDLAKYRLEKGDVLFNRTNSFELVGKTSLFDHDGEFVFASYLVRVRTQIDKLLPTFLNYYLNWEITQQRLRGMATRGVSQSNISAGKLRTFEILLPSISEQQKIVAALESIDTKIRVENQRKVAQEALFASLLSRLMTGETRIFIIPPDEKTMTDEELITLLIKLENDVLYQEPATETEEEFKYIPGRIPILLSAPHGAVHTRNGKQKEEDEFTGGFAQLVGQLTGAHIIYARRMSSTDPNFDDGAAYKSKIEEIKKSSPINFALDIHGIRADLDFGIALGTINWESCPDYKNIILKCFSSNGFSEFAEDKFDRLVDNHPEYSGGTKQNTVTRYCMRHLKVPAAQIELNAHLRIPNRRSDASQPDKSFQGNPVYIVKAIRAICALVQALSEKAPSIQSN